MKQELKSVRLLLPIFIVAKVFFFNLFFQELVGFRVGVIL